MPEQNPINLCRA